MTSNRLKVIQVKILVEYIEECNDSLCFCCWLQSISYQLLHCGLYVRVCGDVCIPEKYMVVYGTHHGGVHHSMSTHATTYLCINRCNSSSCLLQRCEWRIYLY